jgi:hypothetical protein
MKICVARLPSQAAWLGVSGQISYKPRKNPSNMTRKNPSNINSPLQTDDVV